MHKLSGNKWVNCDVEAETGSGIVPFTYKRSNYVNAIQWGIGLELALLVKDPWRIFMTTDHPNGAPFTKYPLVISWLVSKKAREKALAKINNNAKRRLDLPGMDREYTLSELAIVTRAATAKALGLKNKGHLGIGADADVAIYDFDPSTMDASLHYPKLKSAFSNAHYTIKSGKIVSKKGEILECLDGRTYWAKSNISKDLESSMLENIKDMFEDHYTVRMSNYVIGEDYLNIPEKTSYLRQ